VDPTDVPSRVDQNRLEAAIDTADFIADHHDEEGQYHVDEHWGPEGELYRALCIVALVDAYRIVGQDVYIKTARHILERFHRRQREEGGWTISLGDDGLEFKISAEERRDTERREDPIVAGAALKAIAEFQSVSDSEEFTQMGQRAFEHLLALWDPTYGSVREDEDRHLAGLRSNPSAYHFLFLLGFSAWKQYAPDKIGEMLPIIREFVQGVFEDFDTETMPLMYGYHVAALAAHSPSEYCNTVIEPGLDEFLTAGKFRGSELRGGLGHHDGLRGIVTDEAHMRSNAGLAIGMKLYDLETDTRTFRTREEYSEIVSWIDRMKAGDGGYYEYQKASNKQKLGKGAGGQYLPCFWIFGRL